MNEERLNPDLQMLRKACETLGEHFDTVHIFAGRHDPAEAGGTVTCRWGSGNWYARYGQIKEWVICQEQQFRNSTKPTQDGE